MSNINASLIKAQNRSKQLAGSDSIAVMAGIRNNIIAVIGYELLNPLATIQVCLESLANEREMPSDAKQIIIESAFSNVQYLHSLIQDCIESVHLDLPQTQRQNHCCQLQISLPKILQKTLRRIIQLSQIEIIPQMIKPNKLQIYEQEFNLLPTQFEILKHIFHNLIAIVGHELRTPLCSIEICLESLANYSDIPSVYRQQMLDLALNDITRLKQLIRDFLILDRLEKGHIYQRSQLIKLPEVIELALLHIKTSKQRTALPKIIVDLPSQLPLIRVDEDHLIEALIKLLDNACKFTEPEGEIRIQGQLIRHPVQYLLDRVNDDSTIEVIVSDTGRGIAPSHLEAIFNCFYQEENYLRRTVNGAGIGLTICRKIINSFGGKIWAESAGKDCGSSIHFTLPIMT